MILFYFILFKRFYYFKNSLFSNDQNYIFIKVRHSRTTPTNNIMRYGNEDSEFKADIRYIEKHYFKFKENRNITFYFFGKNMIMSKVKIDHTNCT